MTALEKKSNANYVKFQIFKAENVVTKKAGKSQYQKKSLVLFTISARQQDIFVSHKMDTKRIHMNII